VGASELLQEHSAMANDRLSGFGILRKTTRHIAGPQSFRAKMP